MEQVYGLSLGRPERDIHLKNCRAMMIREVQVWEEHRWRYGYESMESGNVGVFETRKWKPRELVMSRLVMG